MTDAPAMTEHPKFPLGTCLCMPGVLEVLPKDTGRAILAEFLALHQSGEWGHLDAEDKQANEDALNTGARILSAYRLPCGTKIYVITEAADEDGNRPNTTILLPEEY